MPKIFTTLEQLRKSGRVCPVGYAQLLRSQGKTKADDTPIDVMHLIDPLGHHAVMRGFSLFPEHEAAFRGLAVQFARGAAHLAADRWEAGGLDLVSAYLAGKAGKSDLAGLLLYEHASAINMPTDEWQVLSCQRLASLAIAATALEDGTRSSYFAALAVEMALSKAASCQNVFKRLEVGRDGESETATLAARWAAIEKAYEITYEERAARSAAEARHTAMLREFLSQD